MHFCAWLPLSFLILALWWWIFYFQLIFFTPIPKKRDLFILPFHDQKLRGWITLIILIRVYNFLSYVHHSFPIWIMSIVSQVKVGVGGFGV
jgi:hypothetical protein